jgi:hypothetical protein
MMQNSLERLLAGIADSLRDVVLPAVDDGYARSQLTASIELLANLATRVAWDGAQLAEVTNRLEAAVDAFVSLQPAAGEALPPAGGDDPTQRRDRSLARLSAALRWCDDHAVDEAGRRLLLDAATWHLDFELVRLRTGMYAKRTQS